MSADESEASLTTSPPGRRRKQTIMGDSHPDLHVISTTSVPDVNKTAEFGDDCIDTNPALLTKSEEPSDHNIINACTDELNDTNVDTHSDTMLTNQELNDEVFETTAESVKSICESKPSDNYKPSDNSNKQKAPPTDIVYDETKPKRLSHPKHLKIDTGNNHSHTLRESISYLISPDEPEERPSPNRRRRKPQPSASAPDFSQLTSNTPIPAAYKECSIEDQSPNDSPNTARKHHYQRSPETSRRKVSSPVQRLIVKNGQTALAVAANSRERKSSVGARLVHSDQSYAGAQRLPRRKISSDARLEHRAIEEQLLEPTESIRKRKVSFDTTALVNGNKVTPLNDRPTFKLSFQEEPEYYEESSCNDSGFEHETGARPKLLTPPVVIYPGEVDEGFEQADSSLVEKSNSDVSEEGEEGYASGYDNKAYIADDEDSLSGNKTRTPPPTYIEYTEENIRNSSPVLSSNTCDNGAAVIPHSVTQVRPTTMSKKVSSSSLPSTFGRRGSLSEMYTPKSILKVRPVDTESMASQESAVAAKTFKLRKDSIALFMDSNTGNVAMQELRKEYAHHRWKCFGKSDIKQLWADRKQLLQKYKLHLLVLALFFLTFAFVVIGLHFHSEHHKNVATSQKIFFDGKTRVLSLTYADDMDTFTGTLGIDIPDWKHPTHCYANYAQIYDKTCLKWKEHGKLDIHYFTSNNTKCYNVTWNMKTGTQPYDCFHIGSGSWYGPLNMSVSQWPIRSDGFTFTVNKARHHGSGTFSSAIEYYWLSSNGEAIVVDSNYPIEISWNRRRMGSFCIVGKNNGDFYYKADPILNTFHYTVCNGANVHDTHSLIRNKYFPKIIAMPEKSFLKFPHWSTVWDSDNFSLNDTVIEEVAESISDNKLNCSSIEIDGKWESRYGDISFNKDSFKNMSKLLTSIVNAGCEPSLNVYPFFNLRSSNFQEGVNRGFFVKSIGGTVPSLVRWQHGIGAMLDVSNQKARDWYTAKVRRVASEYDIRTFRLAYGTMAWVPHKPVFHAGVVNPNKVKQMFSNMVSGLGNIVVQSTSQSQHLSTLLGISSSVVTNNGNKCLKNIIPDILNLGIMGYPFLMSDGFSVELKSVDGSHLPNRKLFLRWMQLSSFLPAMRYTIKPWSYDNEVVEASRNLTQFHSNLVLEAIYRVKDKILLGEPIIKPMWWDQPKDRMTFTIDDQFVMADTFLVAPILCDIENEHHISMRDIYIPDGVWKDMVTDKIILGPRWIRKYKVTHFHIPYFEKMAQYTD